MRQLQCVCVGVVAEVLQNMNMKHDVADESCLLLLNATSTRKAHFRKPRASIFCQPISHASALVRGALGLIYSRRGSVVTGGGAALGTASRSAICITAATKTTVRYHRVGVVALQGYIPRTDARSFPAYIWHLLRDG